MLQSACRQFTICVKCSFLYYNAVTYHLKIFDDLLWALLVVPDIKNIYRKNITLFLATTT